MSVIENQCMQSQRFQNLTQLVQFGGFSSQNSKYVHLKCKDQNYNGITSSQTS